MLFWKQKIESEMSVRLRGGWLYFMLFYTGFPTVMQGQLSHTLGKTGNEESNTCLHLTCYMKQEIQGNITDKVHMPCLIGAVQTSADKSSDKAVISPVGNSSVSQRCPKLSE